MKFADRLHQSIKRSKSVLVAGFDPVLDDFPKFILEEAGKKSSNSEELIYLALTSFYQISLDAVADSVAAIKPNIAFFEQYGVGGIRAFASVCSMIKEKKLPVIADAKRGDIGSTATAYSAAFLGRSNIAGKKTSIFDVDALTVNPFLGFDTLEPFLNDCREYDKGIFVLVKTSNEGSAAIQGLKAGDSGKTISEQVAQHLASLASQLMGDCGYSGVGAVVGATWPKEAALLREIMPKNYFLIPGFGAQGGSTSDAQAGFAKEGGGNVGGAVVNASRAIFGALEGDNPKELEVIIEERVAQANMFLKKS